MRDGLLGLVAFEALVIFLMTEWVKRTRPDEDPMNRIVVAVLVYVLMFFFDLGLVVKLFYESNG